jgi:hypothetical protein
MASKVIISLDGVSSAITADYENIKRNIFQGCRMLGLEPIEYENKMDGFSKLREDVNDPDTLLITTDSLPYHLCDNAPVIVISRSLQWAQSSPKSNCIGRLTHEMIERGCDELVGMIARNRPMRQFHDHGAAKTFLVFNDHPARDSETLLRYSMAAASWAKLGEVDYHLELVSFEEKGLPFVSSILQSGKAHCTHPYDIVLFINRDICLCLESIGILRSFMDSRNIDECYSHRVDRVFENNLSFKEIRNDKPDWGIDLFAFRPSSSVAKHLCEVPLYIGRSGWDLYWASKVKIRLPYNISYHHPHISDWKLEDETIKKQNAHNYEVIWAFMPEIKKYDKVGFAGLGPIS